MLIVLISKDTNYSESFRISPEMEVVFVDFQEKMVWKVAVRLTSHTHGIRISWYLEMSDVPAGR